jgi:methyl-accepting chemotaxis protein
MFPRLARKQHESPLPVTVDEDHFAEIIERLPEQGAEAGATAGRFGRALAQLIHRQRRVSLDQLATIAQLSRKASETAVNAIWVSHDVHEMTRSARAISGAVEELATSTSAIAENSLESATRATRATDAMSQCAIDSQAAAESMGMIERRASDIEARLDVLDGAAAQISAMADQIEALAESTNMLALNATIEAARAGDAGRGFAVVASEVKALSRQTGGVTEEIRRRLSAFAAEMTGIRASVGDSRGAVAVSRGIVHGVANQVASAGTAMNEIAERARELADHLTRQRAATAEIAKGTDAIAGKIAKSEKEISAIDARLATCERTAARRWHNGEGLAGVARIPADAAIFKHRLAAILTRLQPPTLSPTWLNQAEADSGLRLLADFDTTDLQICFKRAVSESETFGRQVIDAVAAKDWAAATRFYELCERALDEASAAAGRLLRTDNAET